MKKTLENQENLDAVQDIVTELITENGEIRGIKTKTGLDFKAKAVIVATGTFLRGLMYIGEKRIKGGRMGGAFFGRTDNFIEKFGF